MHAWFTASFCGRGKITCSERRRRQGSSDHIRREQVPLEWNDHVQKCALPHWPYPNEPFCLDYLARASVVVARYDAEVR